MPNQFYTAIDRHRIQRGLSIKAFAEEIGVAYDVAWNTFKRSTKPHDQNREKFVRYFYRHQTAIIALMASDGLPEEVQS